jgi:hypothetical protein
MSLLGDYDLNLMTINIIERDTQGNPTLYGSDAVYTVINGKSVWISDGYQAKSIDDIYAVAMLNIDVRRMIMEYGLSTRM